MVVAMICFAISLCPSFSHTPEGLIADESLPKQLTFSA